MRCSWKNNNDFNEVNISECVVVVGDDVTVEERNNKDENSGGSNYSGARTRFHSIKVINVLSSFVTIN